MGGGCDFLRGGASLELSQVRQISHSFFLYLFSFLNKYIYIYIYISLIVERKREMERKKCIRRDPM